MKLILASASPRRAQLLADAGYTFDVIPADVDEKQVSAPSPSETAMELAILKARTVAELHPDDVVLAADTIVCLGEEILGKPENAEDAAKMLSLLSGTTQVVITGLCVMRKSADYQQSSRILSAVRVDKLTPEQIEHYVGSGDWQGKAGGYGIQDKDPFVKRIAGSHSNVVGLPVKEVGKMLASAGITPKKGE